MPDTTDGWDIIGPGAMGCLWASALSLHGSSVRLIGRDQGVLAATITIERNSSLQTFSCPYTTTHNTISSVSHRALLVTLKAYQTISGLQSIESMLNQYHTILLMQNGMGVVDEISRRFGHLPLLIGITTHGAYRRTPRHIVHAGSGDTWIGDPVGGHPPEGNRPIDNFLALWNGKVTWDTDIKRRQWIKLGVNIIINGLAVLHQCPNGEILDARHRRKVLALAHEIEAVMSAELCSEADGLILQETLRVAEATASNICSMRQDLAQGRQTELAYLHEYLVRKAQEVQLPVPENTALLNQLHQLHQFAS